MTALRLTATLLLAALALDAAAQDTGTTAPPAAAPTFRAPVRLEAGGAPVRVESPGYASPCWHDVDGDGKQDLIVGQFRDGKMKVYRGLGDGKLAAGTWLEAEGAAAKVPGVW